MALFLKTKSNALCWGFLLVGVTEDCLAVGLARVGSMTQQVAAGTLLELSTFDLGQPLHSLIVVGKMHCIEKDMLRFFAVNSDSFDRITKDV